MKKLHPLRKLGAAFLKRLFRCSRLIYDTGDQWHAVIGDDKEEGAVKNKINDLLRGGGGACAW